MGSPVKQTHTACRFTHRRQGTDVETGKLGRGPTRVPSKRRHTRSGLTKKWKEQLTPPQQKQGGFGPKLVFRAISYRTRQRKADARTKRFPLKTQQVLIRLGIGHSHFQELIPSILFNHRSLQTPAKAFLERRIPWKKVSKGTPTSVVQ